LFDGKISIEDLMNLDYPLLFAMKDYKENEKKELSQAAGH
jgi:hypothetical protein